MERSVLEAGDYAVVKRDPCDGMGPLERTFGTATSKIMDFLIIQKGMDYSEQEIADMTGLSAKTVSREMPQLVEDRIAEHHRTVGGRIRMYWLHPKSKVASSLETLAFDLAQRRLEIDEEKATRLEDRPQSKLDIKAG